MSGNDAVSEVRQGLRGLPDAQQKDLARLTGGWRVQPFVWNPALECVDVRDEFLALLDEDPSAVDTLCLAAETLNAQGLSASVREALSPEVRQASLRYAFVDDPESSRIPPPGAAQDFVKRLSGEPELKVMLERLPGGHAVEVHFRYDSDEAYARLSDFIRFAYELAIRGERPFNGHRV